MRQRSQAVHRARSARPALAGTRGIRPLSRGSVADVTVRRDLLRGLTTRRGITRYGWDHHELDNITRTFVLAQPQTGARAPRRDHGVDELRESRGRVSAQDLADAPHELFWDPRNLRVTGGKLGWPRLFREVFWRASPSCAPRGMRRRRPRACVAVVARAARGASSREPAPRAGDILRGLARARPSSAWRGIPRGAPRSRG